MGALAADVVERAVAREEAGERAAAGATDGEGEERVEVGGEEGAAEFLGEAGGELAEGGDARAVVPLVELLLQAGAGGFVGGPAWAGVGAEGFEDGRADDGVGVLLAEGGREEAKGGLVAAGAPATASSKRPRVRGAASATRARMRATIPATSGTPRVLLRSGAVSGAPTRKTISRRATRRRSRRVSRVSKVTGAAMRGSIEDRGTDVTRGGSGAAA